MRKGLLGGSALLSILLAMPVLAHAEMEVSVGGFASFRAGFFDSETTNQSRRDFTQESEIHIKAKGVMENGVKYGAKVELLTSTSDTANADEAGIYLAGDFGRVEFGDDDGASDQLAVLAPTVGIGQIDGRYLDYVGSSFRPSGNVKDTGGGIIKALDTDDATKITYFTPRFVGFQAGISYAPEADNQSDGEQVQLSKTTGNQADFIESGLNYKGDYANGMRVRAGLTYDHADAKHGSNREGVSAWGAGARIGYQEFEFGGGYVDNGDSNNDLGVAKDNETAWNVGARYQGDVWGAAVSYLAEDYQTNGGRGTEQAGGTYKSAVVGGSYKIADGLTTGADLAFFNRKKDTGNGNHGYVLVLETKAAF